MPSGGVSKSISLNIPVFRDGCLYRAQLENLGDDEIISRYKSKVAECGNVDPYNLLQNECKRNYGLLPTVTMVDIIMYLVDGTSYTLKQFGAYKSLQSYKHFLNGWVQDMVLKTVPRKERTLILGHVKHSLRFDASPLMVWVLCNDTGKIVTAHCNCMAGLGEVCSHVGTMLFTVEYLVRTFDETSVTDRLSQWPVPSSKNIQPTTIQRLIYKNIKIEKTPLPSPIFTVNGLLSDLIDIGQSPSLKRIVSPFCEEYFTKSTLPEDVIGDLNMSIDESIDMAIDETENTLNCLILSNFFEKKNVDLSLEELRKMARTINLTITKSEALLIENITRCELLNKTERKQCHEFRIGRITGSTFKDACVGNVDRPCKTTLNKICYSKDLKMPLAVSYGRTNERNAINWFIDVFKTEHDNCSFQVCGLIISEVNPIFASTPDILCSCSCCGEAVVEVKCPFSLLNGKSIQEFAKLEGSYINIDSSGMYYLDRTHAYYFQCQMEMYTANRDICYFVIWTKRELRSINVYFDKVFCETNSAKAKNYLYNAAYPEILGHFFSKKIKKGLNS